MNPLTASFLLGIIKTIVVIALILLSKNIQNKLIEISLLILAVVIIFSDFTPILSPIYGGNIDIDDFMTVINRLPSVLMSFLGGSLVFAFLPSK